MKEASPHNEETPFSIGKGRFFICKSVTRANRTQPRYTELYGTEHLSRPSLQTEVIIILNYTRVFVKLWRLVKTL
ncbi:hypothetical protein HMPREF0973_00603 [Prevotella veroralis F0319]|uniref:Uncharacterized protein n=1 Tax=Prevotella veroralis F0319 TaxID=649761 RepID=C9MLX7_9BACT|nr:hypothetical protein HMPREF0973_00603 [Prevotella veroralis F0319]